MAAGLVAFPASLSSCHFCPPKTPVVCLRLLSECAYKCLPVSLLNRHITVVTAAAAEVVIVPCLVDSHSLRGEILLMTCFSVTHFLEA